MEVLDLTKSLISCPSVTPKNEGVLDLLEKELSEIGFKCHRYAFSDHNTPDVDNLFAKFGSGSPHLCFGGHTDVVPVGDLDSWSYNPFKPTDKQYRGFTSFILDSPSNDSIELVRLALKCLEKIYRSDCTYKKAGVIVSDISPQQQQQLSLFDTVNRQKHQSIMAALDSINDKFGKDKVHLAIQGYGRQWKMKQEQLSPCYSTRIEDALKVYL